MNDTQKSLIIVSLLMGLLAAALHGLLVPPLQRSLATAYYNIESETQLRADTAIEPTESEHQTNANALEGRLRSIRLIISILLLGALVAAVISYFVRTRRTDEFEEEWNDDD